MKGWFYIIFEEIIKKYGGNIFSVPAYLLEVKPVIRIDGEIVAEGSAIGFGEDENLIYLVL